MGVIGAVQFAQYTPSLEVHKSVVCSALLAVAATSRTASVKQRQRLYWPTSHGARPTSKSIPRAPTLTTSPRTLAETGRSSGEWRLQW